MSANNKGSISTIMWIVRRFAFFYQTGEASHNSGEKIYLGVMQGVVVDKNQEGP